MSFSNVVNIRMSSELVWSDYRCVGSHSCVCLLMVGLSSEYVCVSVTGFIPEIIMYKLLKIY